MVSTTNVNLALRILFVNFLIYSCEALGIFWGRNSATLQVDDPTRREPRLYNICKQMPYVTDIYIFAIISFDLEISLPHHCSSKDCFQVGDDVRFCQAQGRRIHLGIENIGGNNPSPSSPQKAIQTAKKIWNLYLQPPSNKGGVVSSQNPFGGVKFDGVSLSIKDSRDGYVSFTNTLHRLLKTNGSTVKISLVVQCPFPDGFIGPKYKGTILEEIPSKIDSVLIQAYGTGGSCSYHHFSFWYAELSAWAGWLASHKISTTIVLTPSPHYGAPGDYIPPEELSNQRLIQKLQKIVPNLAVGDASYDSIERVCGGQTYSSILAQLVKNPRVKLSQLKCFPTNYKRSINRIQSSRIPPSLPPPPPYTTEHPHKSNQACKCFNKHYSRLTTTLSLILLTILMILL